MARCEKIKSTKSACMNTKSTASKNDMQTNPRHERIMKTNPRTHYDSKIPWRSSCNAIFTKHRVSFKNTSSLSQPRLGGRLWPLLFSVAPSFWLVHETLSKRRKGKVMYAAAQTSVVSRVERYRPGAFWESLKSQQGRKSHVCFCTNLYSPQSRMVSPWYYARKFETHLWFPG